MTSSFMYNICGFSSASCVSYYSNNFAYPLPQNSNKIPKVEICMQNLSFIKSCFKELHEERYYDSAAKIL